MEEENTEAAAVLRKLEALRTQAAAAGELTKHCYKDLQTAIRTKLREADALVERIGEKKKAAESASVNTLLCLKSLIKRHADEVNLLEVRVRENREAFSAAEARVRENLEAFAASEARVREKQEELRTLGRYVEAMAKEWDAKRAEVDSLQVSREAMLSEVDSIENLSQEVVSRAEEFRNVEKAMEECCRRVEAKEREIEAMFERLEMKREELAVRVEEIRAMEKNVDERLNEILNKERRIEECNAKGKQIEALKVSVLEFEKGMERKRKEWFCKLELTARKLETLFDKLDEGLSEGLIAERELASHENLELTVASEDMIVPQSASDESLANTNVGSFDVIVGIIQNLIGRMQLVELEFFACQALSENMEKEQRYALIKKSKKYRAKYLNASDEPISERVTSLDRKFNFGTVNTAYVGKEGIFFCSDGRTRSLEEGRVNEIGNSGRPKFFVLAKYVVVEVCGAAHHVQDVIYGMDDAIKKVDAGRPNLKGVVRLFKVELIKWKNNHPGLKFGSELLFYGYLKGKACMYHSEKKTWEYLKENAIRGCGAGSLTSVRVMREFVKKHRIQKKRMIWKRFAFLVKRRFTVKRDLTTDQIVQGLLISTAHAAIRYKTCGGKSVVGVLWKSKKRTRESNYLPLKAEHALHTITENYSEFKSDLKRRLFVGVYGMPYNVDNEEWFLEYFKDEHVLWSQILAIGQVRSSSSKTPAALQILTFDDKKDRPLYRYQPFDSENGIRHVPMIKVDPEKEYQCFVFKPSQKNLKNVVRSCFASKLDNVEG